MTVVVATRDRPHLIVGTVRSILQNGYPRFNLAIVDQSSDDRTERVLDPFRKDLRMRYVRTAGRGVSAGRNTGIDNTDAEIIALTDDDCEVLPDWIEKLVAGFEIDERIGVVFGAVVAGEHDRAEGFIPAYPIEGPSLARGPFEKHRVEGIGACMAIRRCVWRELGGFDEMLGAGGRFQSAEELDFAIRALLKGRFIYETPDPVVMHHGFRAWERGLALIRGHLYGIGAMFAKQLKCGCWPVMGILLRLLCRWAFAQPAVDFGHRPPRWMRLTAFVRGFADGLSTGVERATVHFRS